MQRKWYVYLVLLCVTVAWNIYYYRQYLIESYMYFAVRNEHIVISLSTTPHRINKLGPTLKTVLAQRAPVKAIYLNIPYVFKRDNIVYDIPIDILNNTKLTILRSDDFGPATKLLGTLAHADLPANAIIVTLDDDVIYPRNIVLHLAYQAKRNPQRAVGVIGAIPDNAAELGISKIMRNGALVSILQGYAGVAYRRHFFDASVFRIQDSISECIKSDDIYLSYYLALQGVQRQVVHNKYLTACDIRWQTAIGTDENSLHLLNPKPAEKHKACLDYLASHHASVVF